MTNAQDRWLSIHEICEHLGVSSDTVYKWIKQGMPAYRMGRLWKFKTSQVDAWVESGSAADKSDKPDTEQ
jgi:excisionase family DNA binding protein